MYRHQMRVHQRSCARSDQMELGSTEPTGQTLQATPQTPLSALGGTHQERPAGQGVTQRSLSAGPGSTAYTNKAKPVQGLLRDLHHRMQLHADAAVQVTAHIG